jgi:hypothetical protein
MNDDAKRAMRVAVISGATDCAMSVEEAAAFIGISPTTLRASHVPRSTAFGRPQYLKSECLKYVQAHLTHTVELKAS